MLWWKKAVLGVATAGMLAGGATVFAQAHPSSAPGFWAQVADKLGVSTSTLDSAVRSVKLSQFLAYAKTHHLSAAKISAGEKAIQHGQFQVTLIRHSAFWHQVMGLVIQTTAKTMNLKPGQVRSALQQGETLTALANAHHVAPATLQTALTNALKARVQTLLTAKKITTARAQALDTRIDKMVPKLMTRTFHSHSRHGSHPLKAGSSA